MKFVFDIVEGFLTWVAASTGFTYNQVNIIVYFMLIPFVYLALVDHILRCHVAKVAFVFLWIGMLTSGVGFRSQSDRLFEASVQFLRIFRHVGMGYVVASVVFCVVVPLVVLAVLVCMAFPRISPGFLRGLFSIP